MISNFSKKTIAFLGIMVFVLPILVLAQTVQPPSNPGTGITYECPTVQKNGVTVYGECEFSDLINAVINVTRWGAIFALSLSVVAIAWAGFNYMISGDNPGKRKEANEMLRKVVIGIALILLAWLIVNLILSGLGVRVDTFGIAPIAPITN